MTTIHPTCRRCHERYPQAYGLCRRCARDAGHVLASTFEREQARLAQRLNEFCDPPPPAPPTPRRTVVINGEEYEVIFDGT